MVTKYKSDPQALTIAYRGKIDALRALDKTPEALRTCLEAIKKFSDRPDEQASFFCRQADLYRTTDSLEEAKAAFQKAIDLNPSTPWVIQDAKIGLAEIDLAQGRTEEAMAAYDKIIARHKNDPRALANAYLGKAEALLRSGRSEAALEIIKEAIAEFKNRPNEQARIFCSQGRLYGRMDAPEKARESFKKALNLHPTEPWILQDANRGLAELDAH